MKNLYNPFTYDVIKIKEFTGIYDLKKHIIENTKIKDEDDYYMNFEQKRYIENHLLAVSLD